MPDARLNGIRLHYRDDGPKDAPAVVFVGGLGTDLRIWEPLLLHLPPGLRRIRCDLRGHGGSACPAPPYRMGNLVRDAECLLDHLGLRDAVFIGHSTGGMVAQGLAVKRLDQIRALVLINTAARLGTADFWQEQADRALRDGMAAVADTLAPRWFGRRLLASGAAQPWQEMIRATPPEGFAGCAAAMSGTDFYTPTSGLRLPVLGLGASDDRFIPPDLVRETTALIPGSQFALLRRAGHLPWVGDPPACAAPIAAFLHGIAHVPARSAP